MSKKASLGTKRICPACGAKFYDLQKKDLVCPKCEHEFAAEVDVKRAQTSVIPEREEKVMKEEKDTSQTIDNTTEDTLEGVDLGRFEEVDHLDAMEDVEEIDNDDSEITHTKDFDEEDHTSDDDADDEMIIEELEVKEGNSLMDNVDDKSDQEKSA